MVLLRQFNYPAKLAVVTYFLTLCFANIVVYRNFIEYHQNPFMRLIELFVAAYSSLGIFPLIELIYMIKSTNLIIDISGTSLINSLIQSFIATIGTLLALNIWFRIFRISYEKGKIFENLLPILLSIIILTNAITYDGLSLATLEVILLILIITITTYSLAMKGRIIIIPISLTIILSLNLLTINSPYINYFVGSLFPLLVLSLDKAKFLTIIFAKSNNINVPQSELNKEKVERELGNGLQQNSQNEKESFGGKKVVELHIN